MIKPPQSKLFKLKEWLTLPDAARHLSGVCGEEVTEADILRLALDGHLTLSVSFINYADAKMRECIDEKELKNLRAQGLDPQASPYGEGLFLKKGDCISMIYGVWDLPLIGGEAEHIENKYHELIGETTFEQNYCFPAFVTRNGKYYYELQVCFDDDSEYGYRGQVRNQQEKLKRLEQNKTNNPKKQKLLLLRKIKLKQCQEALDDWNERGQYAPAAELPKDCMLVVRTDAIREFEQLISKNDSERNTISPRSVSSETERNNLLKQIGGLALVLAEKNNRYKKGEAPSANAIAESVIEIIEALPEANRYGLGKSSIRDSIGSGIKLITK